VTPAQRAAQTFEASGEPMKRFTIAASAARRHRVRHRRCGAAPRPVPRLQRPRAVPPAVPRIPADAAGTAAASASTSSVVRARRSTPARCRGSPGVLACGNQYTAATRRRSRPARINATTQRGRLRFMVIVYQPSSGVSSCAHVSPEGRGTVTSQRPSVTSDRGSIELDVQTATGPLRSRGPANPPAHAAPSQSRRPSSPLSPGMRHQGTLNHTPPRSTARSAQ